MLMTNTPLAPQIAPCVSVVVVTYNSAPFLHRILGALAAQTFTDFETVIYDNASTDDTAAIVSSAALPVTFTRSETNNGYARGNNAAVTHCRGKYLAFINPDTDPDSDWLGTLVNILDTDTTVGLATSRVVLDTDRQTVNACGNDVHLAGFATCRGLNQPVSAYTDAVDVASVSGAAFIARRDLFTRLGGFDASFFMYVEDTDLSWRVWLTGLRCRYVPESVVAHRYALTVNPGKLFYLERNRLQMLWKCYSGRTLVVLSPVLLVGEILTWAYALLHGPEYLRAKGQSIHWLWVHRADLWARRHATQANRVVSDWLLLTQMGTHLPLVMVQPGVIARIGTRSTGAFFALFRQVALVVNGI